jgi:hypothetical protein
LNHAVLLPLVQDAPCKDRIANVTEAEASMLKPLLLLK